VHISGGQHLVGIPEVPSDDRRCHLRRFFSSFGGAPDTFNAIPSVAFACPGALTNCNFGFPAAVTVTVKVSATMLCGFNVPTFAFPELTFTSFEPLATITTPAIAFLPRLATFTLTFAGIPTGRFATFGASTDSVKLLFDPSCAPLAPPPARDLAPAPAASMRQSEATNVKIRTRRNETRARQVTETGSPRSWTIR
jgi:hypothetical protein